MKGSTWFISTDKMLYTVGLPLLKVSGLCMIIQCTSRCSNNLCFQLHVSVLYSILIKLIYIRLGKSFECSNFCSFAAHPVLLGASLSFLSPEMLNLHRNSDRNKTSTCYKAIIQFWRLSIANQGKSNFDKKLLKTRMNLQSFS